MNLKTNINNLNYIHYMEQKENENGKNIRDMERERATIDEKNKQK